MPEEALLDVVSKGFIPLIHGDAVFDEDQGCAIMSGDLLFEWSCKLCRPAQAVFLTDVAGVYDRPPTEAGAKLIREILVDTKGELVEMSGPQMTTAAHDVTGGVANKLATARRVAGVLDIPVWICEVGTDHALAALRGGTPSRGTVVRRK
mmetsp:Transcript_32325/g.83891  ORF Transcript_32325/g.83891 Transcript_32325/m.83891 type:complete len:150 (-) Transcript_32325:30-479(-)